ncbi:hypothetical protein GQR58_030525 [Nymphon striatum]|nr:hypothetical protein GQR58_030525 [Nymphon striatum]
MRLPVLGSTCSCARIAAHSASASSKWRSNTSVLADVEIPARVFFFGLLKDIAIFQRNRRLRAVAGMVWCLAPMRARTPSGCCRSIALSGRSPATVLSPFHAICGRSFTQPGQLNPEPVIPPAAQVTPELTPEPQPEPQSEPVVSQPVIDETPAEARRAEARLSRDEKKQLQVALKSQGFYNSSIDGSFGRGTRRSMADWQAANLVEPTGVLTTAQRKTLLDQYNAPLTSVGMQRVEDIKAGIALSLPMNEVAFARHESPFAIYDSASDLGAQGSADQPTGRCTHPGRSL